MERLSSRSRAEVMANGSAAWIAGSRRALSRPRRRQPLAPMGN
jgi:hypothetical protein